MSKTKNEDAEVISIVLPESLDSLSDAELETLRTDTISAFSEVYQDGNVALSADDEALLGQLKDVKLALDAEKAARRDASVARAEKAKEFAAAFGNDPEEIDTEVSQADYEKAPEDDEDDEDEDEAANEAPAKAEKAPAKKAEAKPEEKKFAPINVARMKSKQTPAIIDQEGKEVSPFRAGIQAANLRPGAMIGLDEVANEFAAMSGGAEARAALSAQASGVRFSQKFKFAEIEKHFDPRAIVEAGGDADAAIAFATDQSRLKGGSLVAAGGWCAPSETLYDLCELESRDGLLSLPEINIRRGGLRWTMGPDWVDIFANTGFSFTEAQDIAGNYSTTSAVYGGVEGGAGLTSYTLTVNGQTTASIDDDADAATVQAALVALSNVAPGDVVVSGATNPINMQYTFQGALAGTAIAMSATPTGGTGTVTITALTPGGAAGGPKPCAVVPCPAFTETRLSVMGTCVQAGFLMDNAYPELIRRYVRGALTAHAHRLDTAVINAIIAGSTAVSPTANAGELATTAPVLSAIELQVEDIKYKRRMSRNIVLEAVFPYWVRGMIRADLSRRLGVDLLRVTDADIQSWFRSRGVNAQFVYNFDALGASSAALSWPNSLRFILYPAGTWVKGSTDVISLSMLHDSTLNSYNNYTAIFAEEGWSVMQMCPESRIVTVAVCEAGGTTAGQVITCA